MSEQRLVNRITSEERAWIDPRDYGLSREQVKEIAARYGKKIVWQCVDHTDQLLLIAEPGLLPLRARGPFAPRTVMAALPWVISGVAAAGIIVNGQLGNDVHATLAAIVGLLMTVIALILPRLLPRPVQIMLLAREFNGSISVRIKPAHYAVSPMLIGYLAATYGYYYTGYLPASLGYNHVIGLTPGSLTPSLLFARFSR
ncbi:hypothetical protein AB5J62_00205 [Amycolatopsis sp. cg5]|uniref:hypothetical protein n=1 Tax=Amycolatopsis sp. cg5 TaxID=3238802 RepID=UPI00352497B8